MDEVSKKELGARLKIAIKNSGKTQKEIANLLGISENALVNYVKGKRVPDAILAYKIAQLCDIDLVWLFLGKESSSNNISDLNILKDQAKEQEIEQLKQEIANLKKELKKIDHDIEKDIPHLQALERRIKELELENSLLMEQIKLLKKIALKKA